MASHGLTVMAPEVIAALDAGIAQWRAGRLAEAEALFLAALEQAAAAQCVSGIVSARNLLGSLAYASGALQAAEEHHQAVLAQCRRMGLRLGVASSLHNLGLIAALRGDPAKGVRFIDRAISLYETLGRTDSAALGRSNRAALISGRPATLMEGS